MCSAAAGYQTFTAGRKKEKKKKDRTWKYRAVTFEGLIQLALPENDAKVVNGARVELHPEHHVSGRVSVPLVVTLQLQWTGNIEINQLISRDPEETRVLNSSYQDISLQEQAGFDGDADTGVAVSLHVAVVKTQKGSYIVLIFSHSCTTGLALLRNTNYTELE